MVVIKDQVSGSAHLPAVSSVSSTSSPSSSKKLKQSTINFFTKDVGKDKQKSPPAKKPKLVVPETTEPVVIDITEDKQVANTNNDSSINEQDDDSVKVHPLSGLVGTALKRKLRKKKTNANTETSSNITEDKTTPRENNDVVEVVEDIEKDEEEKTTEKVEEASATEPTPKRTRKTAPKTSKSSSKKPQKSPPKEVPKSTEESTSVIEILDDESSEPVVELTSKDTEKDEAPTAEKVEETPTKPAPKRARKTPSVANSKKPQKSTPKAEKSLTSEKSSSVAEVADNKSSEPVIELSSNGTEKVLDESVLKKDEETPTKPAPKRTRKTPSGSNSKKPSPKIKKAFEKSSSVVEISDNKTSEPSIKLTLNDCEDIEMSDIKESKKPLDTQNSSTENSCVEETQVELKTPKNTKSNIDSSRTGSERRLTPKQLQKKLDSEKKRQEKEKEKLERDRKRQEEKDEKQKLKLEKEELRKKEKEDKEEQKRKEREEKEKQKELEKKEREEREELKRKEKEEKELMKKKEKEAKEEDRKRKEIEKEEERKRKELEKEEAELKKKKAAAAFVNFFVPKAGTSKCLNDCNTEENVSKNGLLSIFRIKSDMRLAPTVRNQLSHEQKSKLDEILKRENVEKSTLYLASLKNADYCIKKSSKTWPFSEVKDDCVVIEDDLPPVDDMDIEMDNSQKQTLRAKLFSFSDNRRPPYWGTWRKKSKHISGRRPFGLDKTFLDYEVDSDDEWEEEEPGESVGSVAGSDDEDGDNEYDVDNEFMVPHGYLSEEEALGDDDHVALSPETQKMKLKLLEDEFENERKKTTERLHPRLLGIIWQTEDSGKPDTCSDPVWNFLNKRKMLSVEDTILVQPLTENPQDNDEDCGDKPESEVKNKRLKLSEAMIPDLIKLVHGNTNNKGFLCKEFATYISKSHNINIPEKDDSKENDHPPTPIKSLSKLAIVKKIKEISKWMSCPDEGTMQSKMCWFVEKSIREKYGLEDLSVPNTWDYILLPKNDKRRTKSNLNTSASEESKPVSKEPLSGKKENGFQITKFTKILSREERDKQFASPKASSCEDEKTASAKQTSEPKEKKRVSLLFSGPRGVSLPTSSSVADKEKETALPAPEPNEQNVVKGARSNLLSQFIKIGDKKKRKIDEVLNAESEKDKVTNDDCVVLSD